MGLCLISTAAAIALMMPLKKTEPFVIRVNQNTGEAAVLAIANEKTFFSEMMDKYWLNNTFSAGKL
ncbi:MAG: VirB8/TrbF family protein [Parasutterella sp.]